MAEWDAYNFDIGANSTELKTVRHIVHVATARRIVEDGKIKAGLVYDESRLNKSRISVAWLSANKWVFGSIYGTVEFQFDWLDLLADHNIYWVEAMEQYRPPAYRFLLSKRDIPSTGPIKLYDPELDRGPLKYQSGDDKFYWNTTCTSEFMIEDDLALERCIGLDFVAHNSDYCRPFGATCKDRQQQPTIEVTGGRLLTFILASGLQTLNNLLRPPGDQHPFTPLNVAYWGLHRALSRGVRFNGAITNEIHCRRTLRGALALYGMDRLAQAKMVVAQISSIEDFQSALKDIVRIHFNDLNWEPSTEPF